MASKRFATIFLTNVLLLLCDFILKCLNADARYIGVSGAVKLRNGTHRGPVRRCEGGKKQLLKRSNNVSRPRLQSRTSRKKTSS